MYIPLNGLEYREVW